MKEPSHPFGDLVAIAIRRAFEEGVWAERERVFEDSREPTEQADDAMWRRSDAFWEAEEWK